MEESEKRRERLNAVRMQAAQSEFSINVASSSMPVSLSNPLIETSATMAEQEESCSPRFDFYTDPMSAFSDSKKSSKASNQNRPDYFTSPNYCGSPMAQFSPSLPAGPMNPGMALYSAHQIQISSSPNQITYQEQGSCYSPGPHRSPIGTSNPFTMHPRTPEVWNAPITPTSSSFPYNPSRGGHYPSPGFGPRGSLRFNTRQGWGHWVSHSPSPGSGRGGSPSPGSGRGGSRWYGRSMSPVLGHSSGRGRSSHARLSGPQQFYNQSMLEDPWKFLKPVEWRRMSALVNSLNAPDSSKSRITKSPSTRKTKVSEPSNKSSSQPSLATSFNEAVNDTPSI
ncbi:protein SICKLE-like [Quercus robur]|uniref:protein SICKLE-like n=1 Tax=Quercus robur TaxID=38942 RepID=UPI002163CA15|nr:protein SICKLE-like [Quercus robur]XP_050266137.1 protein SICKLE-like [Quercus robur]